MIDIKIIRDSPDVVERDLKKRGADLSPLHKAIEYDRNWRDVLREVEKLRHKRNLINTEIAKSKKKGEDAGDRIKEMQAVASTIREKEREAENLKAKLNESLLLIPNILHESVPEGTSEDDNEVVRVVGKPKKFSFDPKDHIDLGTICDLVDIERAARVSGSRFYYLKNEAVLLEFAIVQYVMKILLKRGFVPFITPALIRGEVMEGAGFLPAGRDDIYKIEGEDLYLVGTSEQALAGLHMGEILNGADLPLRYMGFSSCFRTEAGSHGRDTKGIFRVHQFDKIEMFIFSRPENSWTEHQYLLETAEEIYKGLDIPYRVVNVCSGEMGTTAAKKYDIEAWLPGQGKYREVVSCSNCTDYQSRRLGIRYREAPGDKPSYVHTLNSTASAIGRTIVAILENYQNPDGSISVPKVLRPYMAMDVIRPKVKEPRSDGNQKSHKKL